MLIVPQGRVVVMDGGTPARSATGLVNIYVGRNNLAPVFNPSSYTATLKETAPVGVSILTVSATDTDVVVSID